VDGLWAAKSEGVGLIVREISLQDFQPMWSWSTNVTDRQTDGRHAIARPRFALHCIENNPAKFYPDPIWNDEALGFLKTVAPTRITRRRDGRRW